MNSKNKKKNQETSFFLLEIKIKIIIHEDSIGSKYQSSFNNRHKVLSNPITKTLGRSVYFRALNIIEN